MVTPHRILIDDPEPGMHVLTEIATLEEPLFLRCHLQGTTPKSVQMTIIITTMFICCYYYYYYYYHYMTFSTSINY